jgi:hypothetical protein
LERHYTRTNWVAYAFDGDWNTAKDRFAKVIVAACADGLLVVNASPYTVNVASSGSAGDLVSTTNITISGSNLSQSLLSKVDVKFVLQDNAGLLATANSADELARELLDNAVVTRNELTMEDMSLTLAQLAGTATGPILALFNLFKVSVVNYHNYGNFVDGSDNPVYEAKLQLNGHDRFQERDGHYFNYVQPYQHFSNTPADGINVYSFALKAEEHQPSGTCNFSRIDNATLQVRCGLYNDGNDNNYVNTYVGGTSSNSLLNIYTVNYNVLRVMSGMAGTAYSN